MCIRDRDYDRVINVEAIKDHAQTNAPDSHYKILHGTVKAGEYEGKLHVDVYNAPNLKEHVDSLRLRVIPVSYTHLDVYKRQEL